MAWEVPQEVSPAIGPNAVHKISQEASQWGHYRIKHAVAVSRRSDAVWVADEAETRLSQKVSTDWCAYSQAEALLQQYLG